MTNGEFYEKEIVDIIRKNGNDCCFAFCNEFISKKVLEKHGLECAKTNCMVCRSLFTIWLNKEHKEHKEHETDWSKVEVDTPILVKCHCDDVWIKRHFAKYENREVYAFNDGFTSYTAVETVANREISWNYAKLWEGSDEQRKEAQE